MANPSVKRSDPPLEPLLDAAEAAASGGQPRAATAPSLALLLPTLNAAPHLDAFLPALERQNRRWNRFLVIDSGSRDGTVERLSAFGAEVVSIPQSEFNHGGTRRRGVEALKDHEIIVCLTQDAILAEEDSLDRLVAPFEDERVGMTYARQLPRPEARGIERHARLFNYPGMDQGHELRRLADRERLGIKTVFCSNSCAAYRRSALMEVGNFPEDAVFAEDQTVSGRMILRGWSMAYCADAPVIHSHDYTVSEDFKRSFDVGVFHARNPWLWEVFGTAEGEGLRYVRSELDYLRRHEPLSIPGAVVRTAAKYAGYRLGRLERRMSAALKARLSMAGYYWRRQMTEE